jgi:hypothetical protein
MTLTEFLLARIAELEARASLRHLCCCQLHTSEGRWPCNCGLPAHVLAECEAKRQIIGTGEFPTHPMRCLATVYADHPDYREEWKP